MGNINASVDLRRDGEIAIVTVDNPPVNALKHEVRAGLAEALRQSRDDAAVKAVVIGCAGRTFFAGADITEFGKPPQSPGLSEVIGAIEAMPKPVVAALHGTALGGGFELALACHFRVAVAGARVGLPEVKLGLLPGAGGTQRLPRLIGPEKALKMIVTGDPIEAREALADGVIDEIVDGDLTAGAIAFARRVVAESRPLRLVRDREDKLVAEGFADAAETLTRRLRGRDAPAACVEAVRNAIVLPFDEGAEARRRAVPQAGRRRPIEGPASCLLRRARGGEGARHPGRNKAAPDRDGGGDRRRHDGRRHRDVLRQCRHPGHHRRDRPRPACKKASTGLPPTIARRWRAAGSPPTRWSAGWR